MIIATAGGFFRHLDAGKWADIGQATIDTLLMLLGSLPLTLAIGLPLGVLLYLFGAPQMKRRPFAYGVLALVVNLLRSVPFIILMIVLIPVTLFLMGTSLGVRGAIVPLVIGAAPFYARLVETALREVDRGVIEATQSMGATTWQLVTRVLLPEARPGLIAGATVTTVALIGFTAMGGAIGSGGLGDLAFRDGYQRSHTDVALVTVVLLLVLVQLLQMLGDRLSTAMAVRQQHGKDESYHTPHAPEAVAFAHTTEEVSEIVKVCARFKIPVIAFGTGTSLEGGVAALHGGQLQPHRGPVNLVIQPGFRFVVVQGLLTNFHLPKSSLMMLVSAFAGHAHIMALYAEAIAQKYRFFSYGDAMLLTHKQ